MFDTKLLFPTYFIFSSVRKQLHDIKVEISQQSKRNFELDRDVRFFDKRIALLINHRISVEVKYDALTTTREI